ncbi:hypothetical protein ACFTAO_32835 [Paenibacillus rhizoplanae]
MSQDHQAYKERKVCGAHWARQGPAAKARRERQVLPAQPDRQENPYPPPLYQYRADSQVLTSELQTVLSLDTLQTKAGQRVQLQGDLRISYLPLAEAVRIPLSINVLYNNAVIRSFEFRSIVQGYGSGEADPGKKSQCAIPVQPDAYPRSRTGSLFCSSANRL